MNDVPNFSYETPPSPVNTPTALPIHAVPTTAPESTEGETFEKKADSLRDILKVSARQPSEFRLMIVDDEPINIRIIRNYLDQCGYRDFVSTTNPTEVKRLVIDQRPDLILMDVMMPEMDGLQVLELLRQEPSCRYLPVLILTASTDPQIKFRALELGATDFLPKPFQISDLAPRVRNALQIKAHQDQLANYAEKLEEQVALRTAQLMASRQEIIHCLARAGEYRDHETGYHVMRVGQYARCIAERLALPPKQIELIEQAALLHDVGKIGISDLILLKPGRLTREEFSLMKKHCEFGRDILQPRCWLTGFKTPISSPIMEMAARIAMSHHEWWNGAGYPLGLSGEEIPIEGRITAVADVFDALSSQRPYKAAYPLEKCFKIMEQNRGTQFDPRVFDAFMNLRDWIEEIHATYPDPTSCSDQLVAEPTW
ncbi:MAG: response regulator [Planctomycetales bacterium]|nr:response regulator [Planctomycetales bacterium]